MVCEYHILFAVKVRPPALTCGNYSQELAIPSGIVALSAVQLPAEVLDRLHAVSLVLLQLCSDGEQAGIRPYLEGTLKVGYQKHRGFC